VKRLTLCILTLILGCGLLLAGCAPREDLAPAPSLPQAQPLPAPVQPAITTRVGVFLPREKGYMAESCQAGVEAFSRWAQQRGARVQVESYCYFSDDALLMKQLEAFAGSTQDRGIFFLNGHECGCLPQVAAFAEERGLYWGALGNLQSGLIPSDYSRMVTLQEVDATAALTESLQALLKKSPQGQLLALTAHTSTVPRIHYALTVSPYSSLAARTEGPGEAEAAAHLVRDLLGTYPDTTMIWCERGADADGALATLRDLGRTDIYLACPEWTEELVEAFQTQTNVLVCGENYMTETALGLVTAYGCAAGDLSIDQLTPGERGCYTAPIIGSYWTRETLFSTQRIPFDDYSSWPFRPQEIPMD